MMGKNGDLYAEIRNSDLCGSCMKYRGKSETGNLTGFCPVDRDNASATRKPCSQYKKDGGYNAN